MEELRALGALSEPPGPSTARLAAALGLPAPPDGAEFARVMLFRLYPYASVYLGAEGMLGGEARDRVAGFWRALDMTPPAEPDHLAALLSLYAAMAERREPARKALLWEHLLPWLVPYLDRMYEVGGVVYGPWAELLSELLAEEARSLGPPTLLPLHLRTGPPLPDPREEGGDAFLAALLAPVRTGMILLGPDLARAADELGLGVRVAERAYVLRALLAQERTKVLGWLADEARRQALRHDAAPQVVRTVADWWARRARSTEVLIRELANEAAGRGTVRAT